MLDLATRVGNLKALAVATAMGLWIKQRAEGVLAAGGQNQWQNVLNTEYGVVYGC